MNYSFYLLCHFYSRLNHFVCIVGSCYEFMCYYQLLSFNFFLCLCFYYILVYLKLKLGFSAFSLTA